MHNMKKLILSVFIFTFGFATATHAQQVNTLLTKKLPEAPGKATASRHSLAGVGQAATGCALVKQSFFMQLSRAWRL